MPFNKRLPAIVLLALILPACSALDPSINPFPTGPQAADAGKPDEGDTAAADAGNEQASGQTSGTAEPSAGQDPDVSGPEQRDPSLAASESEMPAEVPLRDSVGPDPYYSEAGNAGVAAQADYQRGLSFMRSAKWSRAEQVFQGIIQREPGLSGPYVNLGIAQRQQGLDDAAEESFNEAIKRNRRNQEAYNQLGMLQRHAGEFKAAEKSYRRAISVWPGYAPIRRNLGILYELYLGDLQRALQHYEAYQSLLDEPDRKVKGWIADLKRRTAVKE